VRHLTDRHNELVILTILTLVRGALVSAHEEASMTCRVAQSSQDEFQQIKRNYDKFIGKAQERYGEKKTHS
jgi:hypothetical protein